MKYLRQFGIILTVTAAGELLRYLFPFPIPGSIYGLVLMLALLCAGIVRLDQVKETAEFLVEIMPLMFIAAAVGLLESWESIRSMLVPVLVIVPVTTAIVFAISGKVTDFLIHRREKRHE